MVQKSNGANPLIELSCLPSNPSISQIMQASSQKEVIVGGLIHGSGCANIFPKERMPRTRKGIEYLFIHFEE